MSSSSGGQYPHQAEFYRAAVVLLVRKWGQSEVRNLIIIMIVISHYQVIIISDDMAWCREEIR